MSHTLSPPAVFRGMLRDIVACADYPQVCQRLGLVPASDDVDRMEHYQSHQRLIDYLDVAEPAICHAAVAADVLYSLTHLADGDSDDAERELFHFIARSATSAVIAHLLHIGVLAVGDEQ
ncbi:hypothetical protein ABZ543_12820 [Streptomyces roseifaciens]